MSADHKAGEQANAQATGAVAQHNEGPGPRFAFLMRPTLAQLNRFSQKTLVEHLGIEITDIGDDYLTGTMPVDARTHQPFGLLHGGASVALAETLGSIAGNLSVKPDQMVVGLEINANHLRSVRSGLVTGTARPFHVGGRTQVWEIDIRNEANERVCVSRLTLAVVPKPIS
jgi:1,4-dihydroxy-2-naphthoyl-CoA hydrolase